MVCVCVWVRCCYFQKRTQKNTMKTKRVSIQYSKWKENGHQIHETTAMNTFSENKKPSTRVNNWRTSLSGCSTAWRTLFSCKSEEGFIIRCKLINPFPIAQLNQFSNGGFLIDDDKLYVWELIHLSNGNRVVKRGSTRRFISLQWIIDPSSIFQEKMVHQGLNTLIN